MNVVNWSLVSVTLLLQLSGAIHPYEDDTNHPYPQCICKPTVRIEMDGEGGGGGGRGGGRPVCNNATMSWLLDTALEKITRQNEQMSEMLVEMKKMEEELGESRDILAARDREVIDARRDIERLTDALLEKDKRIAKLELDSVEKERYRLQSVGDENDGEMEKRDTSLNYVVPRDCSDIQENGMKYSGIYTIYPDTEAESNDGLQVFCDLNTDGGRWTVIQRRQDGSESFERNWNEYKTGFGVLTKEFWIGNDNIHKLTNDERGLYELRVDVTDSDLVQYFAIYSRFSIGNESDRYSLHLGQYNGNAGDSLSSHDGWPFSTVESDNDGSRSGNCSELYGGGGWWFARCYDANLNGRYKDDAVAKTIVWYRLPKKAELTSLSSTEMKIRPRRQ